jgi:hypothetical protein
LPWKAPELVFIDSVLLIMSLQEKSACNGRTINSYGSAAPLDLRVLFAYTEKRSQVNFEISRLG